MMDTFSYKVNIDWSNGCTTLDECHYSKQINSEIKKAIKSVLCKYFSLEVIKGGEIKESQK